MNLKTIFKNKGGLKLVKQYWQSGALFTAFFQLIVLGKSRTALEILRLSTQLKTKQKLQKKYANKLEAFDSSNNKSIPHVQSNKVWVCWLQGMDNAPEIVQACYKSLQTNLVDKEIILITEDNIFDYADFPNHILKKRKDGIITNTHLTDLLRLELLIKYGGMWVDATVLCTSESKNIPSYYFDSDLFLYQALKPGRDGHSHICSSWLISARTNNIILLAVRHLLYSYWESHNSMLDYFLFHDYISIVADYYPNEWFKIVPSDNATPHIMQLRLFERYDEKMWNAIRQQTPFHKLSYKFSEEQTGQLDTIYKKVLEVGSIQ